MVQMYISYFKKSATVQYVKQALHVHYVFQINKKKKDPYLIELNSIANRGSVQVSFIS